MYAYMIISSISVRQYLSFPLKYSAAKMAPGFVQISTNIRRTQHHLICKQIILKIKLVNRAEKRPINSPLLRALLAQPRPSGLWTSHGRTLALFVSISVLKFKNLYHIKNNLTIYQY